MDIDRIATLLGPFLESPLSPFQLEQISTYIDLLLRWNQRVNLTAIRREEEIVPRHFGESLFLARHLFHQNRTVILSGESSSQREELSKSTSDQRPATNDQGPATLDLGSGAGFPALPLKIFSPALHLTLVESNHKKAAFLREVARALTFTDINVINARAETLADPAFPRSPVVTLRAVESFQTILPLAATLLAPGGTLAILIGASQLPHLPSIPNIRWNEPIPIPQSRERVLSIGAHN